MKREDVSKIIPGITPEQLDGIMNLHGADITAKANEITTLEAEKTTLTEQLNTANGKLEGYDPEWKAKAEQAKADAASQVMTMSRPSRPQTPAPSCRTAAWCSFPHPHRAAAASPQTHMRPQMLHSAQRSARKVDYYGY